MNTYGKNQPPNRLQQKLINAQILKVPIELRLKHGPLVGCIFLLCVNI